MKKIGFIGAGNMGYAMLKGLLSREPKGMITFTAHSEDTEKRVEKTLDIACAKNNLDLVKQSKYVVLAVKPHQYISVMHEIKNDITADKVVISIAPGFTINEMQKHLGVNTRIVRSMPNTPAMVGEGMNVLSFSKDSYNDDEIEAIKGLFRAFGSVEVLDESYLDAVVPLSGSSPAYVYMMIEAMADAGVLTGLSRELSYKLAAQAILGAAKMVLETGIHPGELKDAVCSPGGTTIEAVTVLEKNNFRNTVIEAMISCYNKTKKLV